MDSVNGSTDQWLNLLSPPSREEAIQVINANRSVAASLRQEYGELEKIRDQVVALRPELAINFGQSLLSLRKIEQQVSINESGIGLLTLSVMQNAQSNNAVPNLLLANGSVGQVRPPVSPQAKSLPNPAALVANGQPNLTASTNPPLPATPKSQLNAMPQAALPTVNQAASSSHNATNQGPIVQPSHVGPLVANATSTGNSRIPTASVAKTASIPLSDIKLDGVGDGKGKLLTITIIAKGRRRDYQPTCQAPVQLPSDYRICNIDCRWQTVHRVDGVVSANYIIFIKVTYKDRTVVYFEPPTVSSKVVASKATSTSGNSSSSNSSSSTASTTTSTEKQASKLSKKRADREQNDSEKADSSKRNKKEIIVIKKK